METNKQTEAQKLKLTAEQKKALEDLSLNASESISAIKSGIDAIQEGLLDHSSLAEDLGVDKSDIDKALLNNNLVKEVKDKAKLLMISVNRFNNYANNLIVSKEVKNIQQKKKILSELFTTIVERIENTQNEIYEIIKLEAYKNKRKAEFPVILDGLIKQECIKQNYKGDENDILERVKKEPEYQDVFDQIKNADKSSLLEEVVIFNDEFNKRFAGLIADVVEMENRPGVDEVNIFHKENKLDIKFYGADMKNKKLELHNPNFYSFFKMQSGSTNFIKTADDMINDSLINIMVDVSLNKAFKLNETQQEQLRKELHRVLILHIQQQIEKNLSDITVTGCATFTEGKNYEECQALALKRAQNARTELAKQYGIKDSKLIKQIKLETEIYGPALKKITSEFNQENEYKKLAEDYNNEFKKGGMQEDAESIKDRLKAFNEDKITNDEEKVFFEQYIADYQSAKIYAKETSPLNLELTASTGPSPTPDLRADAGGEGMAA
jgi:hypothetical protein